MEGFYDKNGQLQNDKVKMLSRPYAYAICGKPLKHKFDVKTEEYELTVEKTDNNCDGFNTELSLNQLYYYTGGFKYSFDNCGECALKQLPDHSYRYQVIGMKSVKTGVKVTLHIKPSKKV